MLKILKYLKTKEWVLIALCVIFIVGQVWLDLRMPEYMGEITMLIKTDGGMSDVWAKGGLMLACAVGSLVLAVSVGFLVARIGASFSQRLRSELFNKVDSFSMAEINKFSTPSLITRTTNDVTQVQMFIAMGLQMLIKAPILAIWSMVKISGTVEWTIATVIAVAVMAVVMVIILLIVLPKFRKMQTLTDNLGKVTREGLTGLPIVRAYNAEKYQEEKFEKANNDLVKNQLFTSRAMAFAMPVMMLIMNGLALAVYWIGAALINGAGPSVYDPILEVFTGPRIDLFSNMMVFTSYSMQVMMAFIMIVMMFVFMPRAVVSARRINEVLSTPLSIIEGNQEQGMENKIGEVEFRNVSFKYPDAPEYILHNVNFTASQGETVAIIGSIGSGKSTLINLVPRFYDATEGEILIDGVNVKQYKTEALNHKIGYISQKAVLFSGTVSDNVAFGERPGEEANEEDIKRAVKIAQGTSFVEKMEGAYTADISRGGANISGGQKQRLSIARAIAKNPEILIFDDSFSALDYKTDRALRTALKKKTKGQTNLIVAQRIGTIIDADKIVVLEKGRVVGIGTHHELLESCTVYKEIAMSQLSEEELAV